MSPSAPIDPTATPRRALSWLAQVATEKAWNQRLNVWLRSPGLVICTFSMYLSVTQGPEDTNCAQHPWISMIVGGLCFINGQYYMQQVTGNTYLKVADFGSRVGS